jgi:hypothetical protein
VLLLIVTLALSAAFLSSVTLIAPPSLSPSFAHPPACQRQAVNDHIAAI